MKRKNILIFIFRWYLHCFRVIFHVVGCRWCVHWLSLRVNHCFLLSVMRTPHNGAVVQRRSKTRSYRRSYRSCLGTTSRLCLTPALTTRRLNASRRAVKPQTLTVSFSGSPVDSDVGFFDGSLPSSDAGASGPGASGLVGEVGVAAVVRYSALPVPTHAAEELLQTAVGFYCGGEAAGFGRGGQRAAEQLQGLLVCASGVNWVRERPWNSPHTGLFLSMRLIFFFLICR